MRLDPILLGLILSSALVAPSAIARGGGGGGGGGDVDPPFEITEPDRARCRHYDPYRQPFFGTTHSHTGLSFDASLRLVSFAEGNGPRSAYQFAKGERRQIIPGPFGIQGATPLRRPRNPRPLDWGAITDHSEHFGEMGICKDFLSPGDPSLVPGRTAMECRMINGFPYRPGAIPIPLLQRLFAGNAFTWLTLMSDGPVAKNTTTPLCLDHPEACAAGELKVWDEVQNAAHDEYDTSRSCRFTTFVAYENTSTPSGTNYHRNVIFRNDRVVRKPVTAIDMAIRPNRSPTTGGPDGVGERPNYRGSIVPLDPIYFPVPPGTFVTHPLPEPFWNKLERDCTRGRNVTDGDATHCDFLVIGHNTNLGGGGPLSLVSDDAIGIPPMYFTPFNKIDAERKAKFEPLIEIYQDKGSSECRWDPRFAEFPRDPRAGVETRDEFCNFEILDSTNLGGASGVGGVGGGLEIRPEEFGPRAYVRNILKDGLLLAETDFDGVNPFKVGIVSATDNHNGLMGFTPEDASFPGHLGIEDAWPVSRPTTVQNSSGGHSVVWAEENSRDAIFAALRRKETYGTSGTRPIVRFFGGWDFDDDACGGDFVREGYENGVPMGGDLGPRPNRRAKPRFIAAAWKDDHEPATNLQQIQIVKGWVQENRRGKLVTKEKVIRVAGRRGDPSDPRLGVDDQCNTRPGGREHFCAVWEDPDFDPSERAFYYVRVLEQPVCRYSTHWCRDRIGVDPFEPDQCREDLRRMAEEGDARERLNALAGAMCCMDQTSEIYVQPVIQERAWTSPIYYEPAR